MLRQTSTLRHSNYCLHFYLRLSQAISQPETTPSFSLYSLQCVRSLLVPYEQTGVPRAAHGTPSSHTFPLRFGQVTVYQTGIALTEKYPEGQDRSQTQRTSSEHQVVSGNSTLKGDFSRKPKTGQLGTMLSELDCFVFFFGFKSSLVCPFVKAADGGGKGDGNSSSFQERSAGRARSSLCCLPCAFMASRRLALAAPGDQA